MPPWWGAVPGWAVVGIFVVLLLMWLTGINVLEN